ncbi:MAG: GH25 family lysozyme [Sedimentitalea sp.]
MRILLPLLIALLVACTSAPPPPNAPLRDPVNVPGQRYDDYDPHGWEGRSPAAYSVYGIDVARFQGGINWNKVAGDGVSFAFMKATEGGDLLDPTYKTNRVGARRAGLRTAAYHFYYFCRPAVDQAKWFIKNVPRGAHDLPPVLDLEWNPFSPTCTRRPDGAVVRAETRVFLDMLEAHYGKRPIIYTSIDFYRDTGIGQLRGTDFWLRSVAAHPSKRYPGQKWAFWQFTGTGAVDGVVGPVDINVFSGTASQFATWRK